MSLKPLIYPPNTTLWRTSCLQKSDLSSQYNTIMYPFYTTLWCILFIQHPICSNLWFILSIQHYNVSSLHKTLVYPSRHCNLLLVTPLYTKLWSILFIQHIDDPNLLKLWFILLIQYYNISFLHNTLVYPLYTKHWWAPFAPTSGLSSQYITLLYPLYTKLCCILLIKHIDKPHLLKPRVYPLNITLWRTSCLQNSGLSSQCNTIMYPFFTTL